MEIRQNLVKFIQEINQDNSEYDSSCPEYYCLDCVMTDEMLDVAITLKLRQPASAEVVSANCGKSVEETTKILDEIVQLGILELTRENGILEYVLPIFVPGIMEIMVMDKDLVEKYPQIARSFEEYTIKRTQKVAHLLPLGMGSMRVIPVETALNGESRKAEYEEISFWLDKYQDSLGVAPCQCRRTRRMMNEGAGDREEELCIVLGDMAETCIKTNRARRITKEEAYEIINRTEELGYMHQVSNLDDGQNKIFFICNCHVASCLALRVSSYFGAPNASRSNYVAKVNKDNCVACGQCTEVCPANAAKLGEKLCQKNPIEIKETKLPDGLIWGPENYNPDFRTNRKNIVEETGTAPCKTECPAHIAVQGYIKLASQGRYKEALELIKKENPLPAVCGRICPRKCESACTRGDIDDPVAIDEIKKFIANKDMDESTRFVPKKLHSYEKKIAVVGSGPAGLSCAYFLAVEGYRVTVFEKQEKLGGMLTLGIPSFRLEKEVVEAEIDILRTLGVEFKTGIEVGKDITIEELRKQGYEGFHLAIGAQGGRKLNIEGENAKEVITGVDFLRDVNLGVSEKLRGNVVVIGGGNVAIDVARVAARENADNVSLYCLENEQEMPALSEEIEEALHEDISIHNSWGPTRIISENGKVSGVEFKKCLSVFDENHKFSPKFDDEQVIIVPADYVLLSIGQSIEWGNLLDDTKVELGRGNTAIADPFTYVTADADIFVGGDAYTGPKYAIDAIAAGKQAAISIDRAVWEGHSLVLGRDRRDFRSIDKENIVIESYDTTTRQRPLHNVAHEMTDKDTRVPFTEEQIKAETLRCLGCGTAVVDANTCIGCGICTTRCKFDAISLDRKYDKVGVPYEVKRVAIKEYVGQKMQEMQQMQQMQTTSAKE